MHTNIPACHRDTDRPADIDKIGIYNTIEDQVALSTTVNNAGAIQNIEVTRDVGLCQTDLIDDIVNGTFFGTQTGEDTQARWISQKTEVVRHLFEYL